MAEVGLRVWKNTLGRLCTRHVPIAYRLGASFTALIVAGMGLLGALVLSYQADLMRQQINEYGSTIVSQFAHSATEPLFIDDHFALQVMTNNLTADAQIIGAAVFDETGEQLFAAGDIPEQPLRAMSAGRDLEGSVFSSLQWQLDAGRQELISFMAPISFQDVIAGHALVSLSVSSIQSSFERTAQVLLIATAVMTLLAVAIAAWMSRRMAKPVEDLVTATDLLAAGNFDIALDTRRRDELGKLSAAFNRMARSMKEKSQMEGVLSRFVADDVAQAMLSDLDKVDVGCTKVDASVLFVDIVGFTELTESSSSEEVVELLNEYFAYFTVCSRLFFGTVDKFIGDCAMIIFGAPKHNPDHRFNAIACASVMLRLLEEVNVLRKQRGQREVNVRIGVNSGEMMAGIVGASQRMEYTVVGDTVNVASRLSRLAEPGDMVVGEAVPRDESLNDRVRFAAVDEVAVRGRKGLVRTYRVTSVAPEYERTMDNMIADILRNPPRAGISDYLEATAKKMQKVS
ncbi:adenylate/guanylate cyclase domain-containing protein [Gilvimarinus sp. F26214L]|uniref:adenylate/guanylate cyclase domain-containing protein n=1 Tax=Gilvimarinus sp. DZF01 TaxID=3461371 RepID=UPI00404520B5